MEEGRNKTNPSEPLKNRAPTRSLSTKPPKQKERKAMTTKEELTAARNALVNHIIISNVKDEAFNILKEIVQNLEDKINEQ